MCTDSHLTIGVVASGGGSAWALAEQILRERRPGWVSWRVATDRPCEIERVASGRNVAARRFEEPDPCAFSHAACRWLTDQGCETVLLFFTRLVTPELFAVLPTMNVHPSLLPAFPGFRPIEAARESGARFLGATLHLATEQPDAGPILAQVCSPLCPSEPEHLTHRRSYVQKAYLATLAADLVLSESVVLKPGSSPLWLSERPASNGCSPMLQPDLHEAFVDVQRTLGVDATGAGHTSRR